MRPEAPVFPPASDEDTNPGTPIQLALRAELERVMPRMIGEIAAAVVNAITPRLNRLEIAQATSEAQALILAGELDLLKERVIELERLVRHPPTLRSPPPDDSAA